MITIISSTNRIGAYTRVISGIYAEILKSNGQPFQILDLSDLPEDFVFTALFENKGQNPDFNQVQNMVDGSDKFVFIIPEYNGSFPGVLKAFIDGLSYPVSLRNKVAALVGIASGAMGGALALSHFTDILNYMGMHVLPLKPRLAGIEKAVTNNVLTNSLYLDLLQMQAAQLMNFKVS